MTRVLMVLTSHDRLGDSGRSTGFHVGEAAHPYAVLRAAGIDVDFASPQGGPAPADSADRSDPLQAAFLDDPAVTAQLADTLPADQVDPSNYDAVLFVGGHGTMWDFPDNAALAATARTVYENGGAIAAVCHGPSALVDLTLSDGSHLVAGKTVAGFTDAGGGGGRPDRRRSVPARPRRCGSAVPTTSAPASGSRTSRSTGGSSPARTRPPRDRSARRSCGC